MEQRFGNLRAFRQGKIAHFNASRSSDLKNQLKLCWLCGSGKVKPFFLKMFLGRILPVVGNPFHLSAAGIPEKLEAVAREIIDEML